MHQQAFAGSLLTLTLPAFLTAASVQTNPSLTAADTIAQNETARRSFDAAPSKIPQKFLLPPTRPAHPGDSARLNLALATVSPSFAYSMGSIGEATHTISRNQNILQNLRPSVTPMQDGIYVQLSAGRSAVLPSDLTSDPVMTARLQEDYPAAGYWKAAALGATTMMSNAILEATGVISTPQPWYLDAALNFGSGYVLGSAFNQGDFHRDLALGGLNALGAWAFQSIFDGPGQEIEDVRYDILAYGAIYGAKGLLPQNGNPMLTNGLGPGNRVINFTTDVIFAGLWDGAAGVTAQSLRGEPLSWDFRWDLEYGLASKAAQNFLYGTRMEFDAPVYNEAEKLARQRAGVDIGPMIDDFELRRGGIFITVMNGGGFAHPGWITINNGNALTYDPSNWNNRAEYNLALGEFLGHEYTHAWAFDRMGIEFALYYAWRATLMGEGTGSINRYEDLANMVDPDDTQEQNSNAFQSP